MKINHIALLVRNIEEVRRFFIKYFDGKSNEMYYNPKTGLKSYIISFEDNSKLELMNYPDTRIPTNPDILHGYVHIAMSVGSKEKVDELTALLEKDKYECLSGPRTTGDGFYESCIAGPEGNMIEITI